MKKDKPSKEAKPVKKKKAFPANPNHLEDFESLLKKAATPRKQPRT